MRRRRALLADDAPLVRMGLRLMCGSVDDDTIVAELAVDGRVQVALTVHDAGPGRPPSGTEPSEV
ncbi:hypothetical protein [Streptomyces sp. NBC_01233]|uniref:hypothetical protein n=1 Tax=Streptomyces sp. NBC_01233 TaxID=2903787 RepID=UPI002E0E9579|nr:hypothetical protein OG332_01710 [Streptomyces sp. NBC_01233]